MFAPRGLFDLEWQVANDTSADTGYATHRSGAGWASYAPIAPDFQVGLSAIGLVSAQRGYDTTTKLLSDFPCLALSSFFSTLPRAAQRYADCMSSCEITDPGAAAIGMILCWVRLPVAGRKVMNSVLIASTGAAAASMPCLRKLEGIHYEYPPE